MDPLYLQDPIKPAATPQAAKGLRDAINNDSPMMSGFVSGTYGYGGSSLLGLANLAEVTGADSVGQGLRKKATALFNTAQKFTPSAMSLDSVKDFGSGVDYVRANAGQGFGSMLPVIAGGAAGLAPGLAAATAPMYGENIGRLEQDPTLSGMSAGQKALHAAPTAAVQGALNYVVPGGFAAAAGRQIASRTGTGALGKAGVTLGTVGLVEGATEGGEELARQGMHTLANPERDTSGDNKQLLESFVGGMVGGSPIGAVQAGAGYVQDRMAEREQDTRTLSQKAGDAIADAGGVLGRRQGERDAAPANAALDAIEQEAQARGVPPREVIAERIQRINTPVDLSDAFTEAEATQRVMQDDEAKRATADELVRDILNDPDASPEMRRAAEEHVAAVQAGATNKYEETGMKLGEVERKRAGVMGIVDTIAKAIEPVAGKPAPAKRGSAMTPKNFGDIEYEGPASDTRPAGEDAFSYTEFSGVPENQRAASGEGIGRVGWMEKEYGETLDENRQRFYGKLFEQIEQQAARSRQPSPVTPEVRRAIAQAPAKTSAEAMRREQLIGKFAVDLRSWLPVGNQLDRLSESLRPRNAFERYARQMSLVRPDNALRSLSVFDWRQLDMALTNFAKGNGDAKVREQLDELFGGPDVTGRVLEMYTPGRSTVNTQQYDGTAGEGSSVADVSREGDNEKTFVEDDTREERNELATDTSVRWGSGSYVRPSEAKRKEKESWYKPNTYFDTDDQAQSERLEKAASVMNKENAAASVKTRVVGMVDAEIERVLGKDASPSQIEEMQRKIVNEHSDSQLKRVVIAPADFAQMSSEQQKYHVQKRKEYTQELAKRVSDLNKRFKTVRAESVSTKPGDLDFTEADVDELNMDAANIKPEDKKLITQNLIRKAQERQARGEKVSAKELRGEFDVASVVMNNPQLTPTNGALILEREGTKLPFFTTANNLVRKGFQFPSDGRSRDEPTSNPEDRLAALSNALTSLIDYSRRNREQSQEYAGRVSRGEVTDYDLPPQDDKLRFTGRVGMVVNGKPVWFDPLPKADGSKKNTDAVKALAAGFKSLPDDFLISKSRDGSKRVTMGDVRAAIGERAANDFIIDPVSNELVVDPKRVREDKPYKITRADTHEERVAALKEYAGRFVLDGKLVPEGTVAFKDPSGNVVYKGPEPEKIDQYTFKNRALQGKRKEKAKPLVFDEVREEIEGALYDEAATEAVYSRIKGGFENNEPTKKGPKVVTTSQQLASLRDYSNELSEKLKGMRRGPEREKIYVERNRVKALVKSYYDSDKGEAAGKVINEAYNRLILNTPSDKRAMRSDPYPDDNSGRGVTPLGDKGKGGLPATDEASLMPNEAGLNQYGTEEIKRGDDGFAASNPGYNMTGRPDEAGVKQVGELLAKGLPAFRQSWRVASEIERSQFGRALRTLAEMTPKRVIREVGSVRIERSKEKDVFVYEKPRAMTQQEGERAVKLANDVLKTYEFPTSVPEGRGRQIKEDKRVVDAGVVTEDVAVPRMRELRDSKDLPVGMLPVVDDFGNIATETETRFVGRMTRPSRPGEMNRQADTVPSRGEDNMRPTFVNAKGEVESSGLTTPLPENARAIYKDGAPDRVEVVAQNIRRGFGGFMGWFKKLTDEQQKGAVSALRLIKDMSLKGLRRAYDQNVDSDLHSKITTLAAKLEGSIIEGPIFAKDASDGPFAVNEQRGHYRDNPLDALGKRNDPHVRKQKMRDDATTRSEATPSKTIPMNFTDGVVWGGTKHNMRPEFRGKSTLELIKAGERTATSRNTKPDVKVGDVVTFTDRAGGSVQARVTKEPYKASELTAEQWSKLEGWEPALYEKYKDAWQFQYELLDGAQTKLSEQNAQTPGEATTDAKRTAELKAALTEVKRLLGKDFDAQVSNELFDPVSGAAWSGEFDPQQMRILIAAGATDTMGTGRHEALHALFKMLRDMGHPEAAKVIENLANNKLVIDKLKILLADHKNALEQLKDPEEAAAYAFQFWMADRLKLGPQAKTFFQKVMNFLNKAQLALRDKVFGSEVAKDERARLKQDALALKLLGAFRDGAMASPEGRVSVQAVLEANKQALEARRLNTRAFGHKLHNFLKQGVYSAASVFEDSANPHVKALGKMFFRMEGDVRGEKQSFLEAAAQANDRYQVKVRNILVKLDKDTAELVSKYMNNRTELKDIHHPEAHAAVKDLRDLLDDLLLYQRNRNTARWDAELMEWVLIGEVKKNYYPRVWSINVLTEKQGEFIEKMTKALEKYRRDFKGFPEIEEFNADKMAKAILNKLINGAGSHEPDETMSDLGITPWQASVNKRDLNWLDDVAPGEFTEYFSDDVAEVMTSYISQATKRAEYNHAFGRGGEKIREGMYNAIVHEMGGVELAKKAASRLKLMRARIKAMSPDAIGAIISEEERKPNLVAAAREVLLEDRLEALNPNMKWTKEMIAQVRLGEYGFLKDGAVKAEDVAKVREGVDKIHADAVAKLEPVTKAIMAMEGTLGREIDPTLRHVMSGVTTFQNFRLLPLALFASINDVVGMVARGGTMKDSFQAFTRGIKEVGLMWKGEYSQDELAKLAERLGTVGGGNYLEAMGQTYSSQFMYGKLRRWNDALFKWNGLEAWNRAARIQATGVAIEFIKRHVEKPNEHSKRYLEELFGKDYDTSLIMKDGDLDYSNNRVQEAVLTWVNGAVLRPNASHRPIYASDPHYMLFYHLKQFAYSFHKVILRRAWIEAKAGNYTPAAALFTGYVPVSIAADVVKETLIMGDDDPWWTKGGLTAYLEHGVARANLGGVPQHLLGDIVPDPIAMFKDPGEELSKIASRASNVLGPAPDHLIDLLTVPLFDNKTISDELAGSVPGGVLIRRYVD